MHVGLNELVEALVLSIQVISRQIEPVHVFLAARHIVGWHVVGRRAHLRHRATVGIATAARVVESTIIGCVMRAALSLAQDVAFVALGVQFSGGGTRLNTGNGACVAAQLHASCHWVGKSAGVDGATSTSLP